MQTNLKTTIETQEQAKTYIRELWKNGELYHLEDNAKDVVWDPCLPSETEMLLLDSNRDKIFKVLPDPFKFILTLK